MGAELAQLGAVTQLSSTRLHWRKSVQPLDLLSPRSESGTLTQRLETKMTEFQTLNPGLLVNMFTKVDGNVTYHNIDRDVKRLDQTEVTDIHTRKQVSDVEEQEAATKVRTKIRGLILSVCVSTAFSN